MAVAAEVSLVNMKLVKLSTPLPNMKAVQNIEIPNMNRAPSMRVDIWENSKVDQVITVNMNLVL